MYRFFFKRVLDFILSLIVLIVLSPFLVLFTLILLAANKSTAFFFQERPGLHKKPFKVIKFKTMNDKKDKNGNLLPDVQRITKIGSFVRKYSIDELPQFFNVLIGDMSLIGPRPLLFKYIPLYSKEQDRRHEVRPGITGLAQVNGRNSISWKEKFEFDVYYVDNLSFFLDMKILFQTVLKVIKREGVNQSSDRPMQPFNGNN
ncbi:MAG: sugar transferase [Bacteroidetes bacterium]|nr:sugar transferase [Bacteroidota bacterium]